VNKNPVNKRHKDSILGGSIMSGNPFILERPRLNALLEKALSNQVVHITAGEGYGKTCAVHAFLRQTKKTAIWIPLSERDNNPGHFWETVISAVGFYSPGAGKVLEETGFPESRRQLSSFLSVISDLCPKANNCLIVADDCHLIRNKAIIGFVNRFLSYRFPGMTIILISRTELQLNTMALFSRGLLTRIDTGDLRFTEGETAAYFRLWNMELPREETKKICTGAEGWILAVSLIAEEMKRTNREYGYSPLEIRSIKAMAESLFDSLPVSLQRFLVVLSIFEHWPMGAVEKIAAALPGKLPPQEELDEIVNRLSSFVRYDACVHGFIIHHVFLDFLKGKQSELSREEIKTAWTISARWCMENRLLINAAINYGMAGDYEGLLKAVYSFPRLMSRTAAASFLEIIDRVINDEHRNERDEWFLFLSHVTRQSMLISLGRYAESRAALEQSIAEFEAKPRDRLSSMVLSACYNSLASLSVITCRKTGDMSRILEYFRLGNHYYTLYPFTTAGPATRASIGSYAIPVGHNPGQGEFEEFIQITGQCVPFASQSSGGFLSGVDSLCRAELEFFKAGLKEAEQYVRKAILAAREKKQYETESKGLFYLLRIQLCNADTAACRETWRQMAAQLDIQDNVNRYVLHDIMTGWFYAHTGDMERIAPWLRDEREESDLNLLYHNFETMVKAKCLFAEKKYSETLQFLERKEVMEGLGSFYLGLLEITVLEAAVQSRMGEGTAALKTLERAYKMSSPGSNGCSAYFDMPFVELGDDIRNLAGAALNDKNCTIPVPWLESIRNRASVYAKKIATVVEQYRNDPEEGEIPLLTPQELSILQSISRGLTRGKIAARYSLSLNMVKTIIKTIYGKLGAFNRADAIRIATKSGLLKP